MSCIFKDVDLAAVETDFPTKDERVVKEDVLWKIKVACLEGLVIGFGSTMVLVCLVTAVEEFNHVICLEALTLRIRFKTLYENISFSKFTKQKALKRKKYHT